MILININIITIINNTTIIIMCIDEEIQKNSKELIKIKLKPFSKYKNKNTEI